MGMIPAGAGIPRSILAVVIVFAIALVLCGWFARRLGTSRVVAWLLLAATLVILAATLMPSRAALEPGVAGPLTCDLSRIGPASVATYLLVDDQALNVLLFIPLGVLIGQLERRQYRGRLMVAAAMLPLGIEIIQALVTPLERACEGGDVFDNLAGLLVGLVIGAAWRRARRAAQPRPPQARVS
jgi:glycopeptide antibiotics resistance protein